MKEIEVKYKVSREYFTYLKQLYEQIHDDYLYLQERNILFRNTSLDVLRVRSFKNTLSKNEIITCKSNTHKKGKFKICDEDEFHCVNDSTKLLQLLGFEKSLIYDKNRTIFKFDKNNEICLDELPFGRYVEIEGTKKFINKMQGYLQLKDSQIENKSYPSLTKKHGTVIDGVIQALLK